MQQFVPGIRDAVRNGARIRTVTGNGKEYGMEYTIRSEKMSVTVQTLGGSLRSIRDREGTEYLWQGDPAYWKDQAPNLFPYIARMTEGKYTLGGREYHMDIHGFVKDSELAAAECGGDGLLLRLKDNEETLARYPYHFTYEIEYRLNGNCLEVVYRVVNEDEKTMYFGIGGHPGFNVPLEDGLQFEDYELTFAGAGGLSSEGDTRRVVFSPACFVTGTEPFALGDGGTLPLRHDLFDDDAIVLTGVPAQVCLHAKNGRKAVRVSYPQMRYLGIWHKPHSDAPYVCIEPWSSLPSRDGIVEDLAKQPGLIALEAGKTYENRWKIELL